MFGVLSPPPPRSTASRSSPRRTTRAIASTKLPSKLRTCLRLTAAGFQRSGGGFALWSFSKATSPDGRWPTYTQSFRTWPPADRGTCTSTLSRIRPSGTSSTGLLARRQIASRGSSRSRPSKRTWGPHQFAGFCGTTAILVPLAARRMRSRLCATPASHFNGVRHSHRNLCTRCSY